MIHLYPVENSVRLFPFSCGSAAPTVSVLFRVWLALCLVLRRIITTQAISSFGGLQLLNGPSVADQVRFCLIKLHLLGVSKQPEPPDGSVNCCLLCSRES